MKVLYLDCFSGIDTGMLPGALMDLGLVGADEWKRQLHALQAEGQWTLESCRTNRCGIDACGIFVSAPDDTAWTAERLEQAVAQSGLSGRAQKMAAGALSKLIHAMARVSGQEDMQVSVSGREAAEILCDLAGTAVLFDLLGVEYCMASRITEGSADAGQLVPVPAVLELFCAYHIPYRLTNAPGALVSPAGAAFAAQAVQEYGPMPSMHIDRIGYGAGQRRLETPHLLRAVLGTTGDVLFEQEFSMEQVLEDAVLQEVCGAV